MTVSSLPSQNNKAAATRVNTPTYARAWYNFASDEHYAQADYTFYAFHADDRIGLLVRVSTDASPNHDGYLVWSRLSTSITHRWYKVVDGFQSWLKDVNENPSPGDGTYKVTVDSTDTIELFVGGISKGTQFDNSLTGQLQVGMYLQNFEDLNFLDNFEAGGLGGGIARAVAAYHQRHHNKAL